MHLCGLAGQHASAIEAPAGARDAARQASLGGLVLPVAPRQVGQALAVRVPGVLAHAGAVARELARLATRQRHEVEVGLAALLAHAEERQLVAGRGEARAGVAVLTLGEGYGLGLAPAVQIVELDAAEVTGGLVLAVLARAPRLLGRAVAAGLHDAGHYHRGAVTTGRQLRVRDEGQAQ